MSAVYDPPNYLELVQKKATEHTSIHSVTPARLAVAVDEIYDAALRNDAVVHGCWQHAEMCRLPEKSRLLFIILSLVDAKNILQAEILKTADKATAGTIKDAERQ